MLKKRICQDCQASSFYHLQTWLEEIISSLTPSWFFPLSRRLEKYLEIFLEKLFISLHLASFCKDFTRSDIQLRSFCFINEAKKRDFKFRALKTSFGYTNHFQMTIPGGEKIFRFDRLPSARLLKKNNYQIIDNKELTKKYLKKGGFPIAKGKSFWFFQKKKAYNWTINQLNFPAVVKPRSGSLSQHLTTDIKSLEQLKKAINKAILYSPVFIIEKFIPQTFVYRATVIDFDFVACVQQIPANVIGDGASNIRKLIELKNKDPQRGKPDQKGFILCQIIENETTKKLLKDKGYNFSTVPKKSEVVYLQKDSFLKLGGDLTEITAKVHPGNLKLFKKIAKFFNVRVVGIDFLAQDISLPWETQPCAILELNNNPCIEMHHFPSQGQSQNVAQALINMVLKYY